MYSAAFLLVIAGCVVADHHGHHGGASSEEVQAGGKPWLGKWEFTGRQENFEAYISALEAPQSPAHGDKVFHKLTQEGDHYHHTISVPAVGYKNEIEFRLGQEGSSNFNNTQFTYTYNEEADGRLHAKYNIKDKVLEDWIKVEGDEAEVTYKLKDVNAKRWYRRVKKQSGSTTASSA